MIILTSSNAVNVVYCSKNNSKSRGRYMFVLVSNENGKFTVALKSLDSKDGYYKILEKNITDLKTAEKSFQSYYDFYSSQERTISYPFLNEEDFRKEVV